MFKQITAGGLFQFPGFFLKILVTGCILLFHVEDSYSQLLYQASSLPVSNTRMVCPDVYGYIWIATTDGVIRTDGKQYQHFTHSKTDSTTLSDNYTIYIVEDSKHRIWIGNSGGLDLYDRANNNFRRIRLLAQTDVIVNDIEESSDGSLWIATSKGLFQYSPESKKVQTFQHKENEPSSLCSNEVYSLCFDKGNNLWIGTFAGLDKYIPESKQLIHYTAAQKQIPSNKIRTLLCDDQGQIWVGSYDRGISVLNAKGEKLFQPEIKVPGYSFASHPSIISTIFQDKQKRIWVGLENLPVCSFNKVKGIVEAAGWVPFEGNNFYCSNVWGMAEDRFHNFWMATHEGLFYSNQKKNNFNFYTKRTDPLKGLQNKKVTSFYESVDGRIWIGTDGGGLSLFDPVANSFRHFTISQGLCSNSILDIKEDKYGTIWLATWSGGVVQVNPKSYTFTCIQSDSKKNVGLPYNNIKALLPDDTRMWIGTHGEGLAVYDVRQRKFLTATQLGFQFSLKEPQWINHLMKDSKNRIWISTTRGLYKIENGKLTYYNTESSQVKISSSVIQMTAEDDAGKIWVAGRPGGVEWLDEKENKFVSVSDQFQLTYKPQAIMFDLAGDLWITSEEGMTYFVPEKGIKQSFTKEEGLQDNVFFQKAIYQTKRGKILVGGVNGFNSFIPGTVKNTFIPSICYFTDLLTYPEKQLPTRPDSIISRSLIGVSEISIQPNENAFTVLFSALNLYTPGKTQYAYQLTGLHTQWIYLGQDQKVTFTGLSPGSYTLKVKYIDANGNWKEFDKYLKVKILPPWYKSWWFTTLLVLLGLSGIWFVFYWRVKATQRLNALLKREVSLRTSELSEANAILQGKTEEIILQNERLEEYNSEVKRQSDKIIKQQEEILLKNQELEKSVRELDLANTTKDRFFSIIAHDLKNPAGTLYSMASLLKERWEEFEKLELEQYISNIERSSFSIYVLLINLLDWAKTQSENIQYKPENLNCRELIQRNLQLLNSQIKEKNIHTQFEIKTEYFLYGDYYMVDTVLRNMLANAVKFTPRNGSIDIRIELQQGKFVIQIEDSGVGMTSEEISTLFRIDQRHFTKGTEGETGSGLGLIITKEFMDYHQGEILVESTKGKGTQFKLVFPNASNKENVKREYETPRMVFAEPLPLPKREQDFNLSETKLARLKGNRILLVDDSRELLLHLRKLLSGTFEIFEAEDGQQGIEKAKEFQPAIIISDMVMPVMDGLEFCKKIKTDINTSHIPVVVLTSQQDQLSQVQGYEAGADVYLTKPVHHQMLYYVLYNILHNQDMVRQKIVLSQKVYPEDVSVNKLDESFLKKIIQYIETHIADPELDYKKLCEVTALSKTLLYAKLKTLTGQSVHEFIKSIRLKKSLELLSNKKVNVNEVAFEVGFNSTSYFIRCFIEQYGMSPKEYQNKE